jgi:hypothetical protein
MTGYQSKKAAAQDKLAQPEQEALKLALEALKEIARHATTPWEDEWCGELANETLKAINALAQPVQEPWRESASDYERGVIDGKKAALAGREWNFCERCGKRTRDLTTIHTCTPPQEMNA